MTCQARLTNRQPCFIFFVVNVAAPQIQAFPQQAYRDNFARHLMGVNRYLQTSIMRDLQETYGHQSLRSKFEPYFSMSSRGGTRVSVIADKLAISRQAANQIANQIEDAGYLRRCEDASDGRAKRLLLTDRGRRALREGARLALSLERQVRDLAGLDTVLACESSLQVLNKKLNLLPAYQKRHEGRQILAAALPPLANYFNTRLMELTRDRGHPDLKPNFGQVLTGIGPDGGRIKHIARSHNVSKQAIGAVVARLQQLDYLERVTDPLDARQQVLHFTDRGHKLITDAVASESELRQHMAGIIGDEHLLQVQDTMATLYSKLRVEQDIFSADANICLIANDLLSKLGSAGARALAQQLLRSVE